MTLPQRAQQAPRAPHGRVHPIAPAPGARAMNVAARARAMGVFAAAFALFSVSCGRRDGDVSGHPAAPTESTEATAHRESALATLRTAEYSRASAAVSDDLLADHDVAVRRAAARALARILDPRAVERLGAKLADEDDEVVAWTAYGIGEACPLGDTHTVRALAARLTSLEPSAETGRPGHPSAMPALLDALSRCGSTPAEATLRAWLEGAPEARSAAALSLARLAARQHHLDDASVVALLDAANASPPVHGALAAFGQLESIPDIAGKRLVQVAEHSIRDAGRERTFAISALLPSGGAGVELLAAVLTDEKLPPAPRTRAAATLGRMGKVAGPALGTAIEVLVPAGTVADARWLDVHFAPVLAALTSLDPPAAGATDALGRVSDLSLPDGAPPSVVRRLVALRCAAGAVLAGSATLSTRLVHCDPDPNGRAGALATLRVLDRGKLSGPRRKVWATYLGSPVPGVRRAALALLPRHLEAAPVVIELANALGAKEPGVVAQAARDLADAPRLAVAHADVAHTDVAAHTATDGAGTPATSAEPSRAIVDALAHAMDAERPPDQVETRIALASAAAGVGALSLKPRLERYCASDSPALRRAAESALRALGANGTSCDAPKTTPAASIAIPAFPTKPVTLVFATDAGRFAMTLDPSFAPAAVARITELARKGFYDGMPILRVSPGYIVQLGDSTGDGSGGAGLPPVPSEGTPVEFGAFAVGLALGGKDTGSSQLFVTASEEPPLFGDYPLLGSADPEWATVAEGDTILHVEVRDGTASHTN